MFNTVGDGTSGPLRGSLNPSARRTAAVMVTATQAAGPSQPSRSLNEPVLPFPGAEGAAQKYVGACRSRVLVLSYMSSATHAQTPFHRCFLGQPGTVWVLCGRGTNAECRHGSWRAWRAAKCCTAMRLQMV